MKKQTYTQSLSRRKVTMLTLLIITFVCVVIQYLTYLDEKAKFANINFIPNTGSTNISRLHRYFRLDPKKVKPSLPKTETMKIVANPSHKFELETIDFDDVYASLFTQKEITDLKKQYLPPEKNPDGSINPDFQYYMQIFSVLDRQSGDKALTLVNLGGELSKLTEYKVTLLSNNLNIFSYVFGSPHSDLTFISGVDSVDENIEKKDRFIENLRQTGANRPSIVSKYQIENNEMTLACPFTFRNPENFVNDSVIYKINSVECSYFDIVIVEGENISVEILTNDYDRGKAIFKKEQLEAYGLSEGPRLRVNYIHKPGGYISPTSKK